CGSVDGNVPVRRRRPPAARMMPRIPFDIPFMYQATMSWARLGRSFTAGHTTSLSQRSPTIIHTTRAATPSRLRIWAARRMNSGRRRHEHTQSGRARADGELAGGGAVPFPVRLVSGRARELEPEGSGAAQADLRG